MRPGEVRRSMDNVADDWTVRPVPREESQVRSPRPLHELCRCTSGMLSYPAHKTSSASGLSVSAPAVDPGSDDATCLPGNSLDALAERLARLERTNEDGSAFSPPSGTVDKDIIQSAASSPQVRQTETPIAPVKKRQYPANVSREPNPSEISGKKRRISQGISPRVHEEPRSPSSTRHASEAREYIEHALQFNPGLSRDRRSVLEVAQKFVSQLSAPLLHRQAGAGDVDVEDNQTPPTLTPELLYMMLPGEFSSLTKQRCHLPGYTNYCRP